MHCNNISNDTRSAFPWPVEDGKGLESYLRKQYHSPDHSVDFSITGFLNISRQVTGWTILLLCAGSAKQAELNIAHEQLIGPKTVTWSERRQTIPAIEIDTRSLCRIEFHYARKATRCRQSLASSPMSRVWRTSRNMSIKGFPLSIQNLSPRRYTHALLEVQRSPMTHTLIQSFQNSSMSNSAPSGGAIRGLSPSN